MSRSESNRRKINYGAGLLTAAAVGYGIGAFPYNPELGFGVLVQTGILGSSYFSGARRESMLFPLFLLGVFGTFAISGLMNHDVSSAIQGLSDVALVSLLNFAGRKNARRQ